MSRRRCSPVRRTPRTGSRPGTTRSASSRRSSAAANVTQRPPTATDELTAIAKQLLAEAEYLFDRERLRGTNDTESRCGRASRWWGRKLRRARELLRDRPGTASVLAGDVLRDLDTIDAARQDTGQDELAMIVIATSDKGGNRPVR